MKQFMLNINSRYQRPIIQLDSWYNFEALLDTGAFSSMDSGRRNTQRSGRKMRER